MSSKPMEIYTYESTRDIKKVKRSRFLVLRQRWNIRNRFGYHPKFGHKQNRGTYMNELYEMAVFEKMKKQWGFR